MIQPADLHDISELATIEEQSFTCDIITPRQFRYLLTRANSIVLKALRSDKIVGYMIMLKRKNSRKVRIYSLVVSPLVRKQGIAEELLAHAEEIVGRNNYRQLTLEVCRENISALQLYKKGGFFKYGEKPGYYEDGCTALLLKKNIV